MVTKKINIASIFLFLFLVLFPFGQIVRIGKIHPIDIVVGFASVYAILFIRKKPSEFTFIFNFIIIAVFSWIVSIFIFKTSKVFYGSLYLIRLIAYGCFFVYVKNSLIKNKNSHYLTDFLIAVSAASTVLGWVQFITFPDLKPLFIWGWDMHLYRLAGTFFDPGYLGLIIVLGLLVTIYRYIDSKKSKFIYLILFFLISLAFTYSRASLLAFLSGLAAVLYFKKTYKPVLVVSVLLVITAFLLPTSRNKSIGLFRTFSAISRVENYISTLRIFESSPLFGIGFNNLCMVNQKITYSGRSLSHACSGSDSSLLLILATTGITGVTIFVYNSILLINKLKNRKKAYILVTSLIAVLVHSLFNNSLFYSWIMGWLAILLAEA